MLAHELAHVRRHDYLVNLLQSVIETLLFFHPAVWWLSRRIRIERENCCDDAAVALLGDRRLYTEALYRTAILGTADSQLAAAATGGDLSQRFRRLLGAPQQRETTTASTWAGVLAITLLAVLCAAAQVSPVVAQIEPPRPAGNQKTAPQQSEPQNAVPPQKLPELLVAQVETTPGPVEEAADAAETDVPEGGPTARDIWSAAQALNKAAIQEMIGAEPRYLNRLHENGFAALHWAADTGRSDALELLLELGANPNVKQGKYGGAPLQYAAAKGDVDAVRVLLARMAAVDAVDSAERTPLMWAAQNRRENVVKVLVEAGADVNAAMKGGWTPLHYAVQDGDAKTAQRLLDAGADFTLPNVQGKTAFEVGPELDVHVPRDFKPAPRPMPRPPAGSGSGSGSGGSDSGSGSGGSDSGGGGAPSGREPDPPSDSVPDENADRSSFSPGSGERFVAAPVETGRATVRVVSTEYAKADGKLERAIAWIENAATGDRAALLYETDGQFDIDLPVGRYELTFTGNGSRGATFQPTKRELAIETPGDAVDLGTVDLPLTVTSRLFGKPAPELDGVVAWKHTDPVRLGELRGKVVVLDFWAWYCTICHQHKPDLAKLHEEFGGRGLEVLAVHDGSLKSMDEMDEHLPDIARRYWGGKDLHLPIALDGSGDGSVFRAYGITAVPAVLLIDQEGRVVRRFHHAGDPDLKAEIARLLD
jgi:ankyrin repeat protein/thiol-disulfide isomerase/thioredoxin